MLTMWKVWVSALRYYLHFDKIFHGANYSPHATPPLFLQNQAQKVQAMVVAPNFSVDTNSYLNLGVTNHVTHDLANFSISSLCHSDTHIHVGNVTGLSV